MKAELLMIGTELLLGQNQDTNATYMGQVLADHGINLYQKATVGDNPERIQQALNDALDRSDVVLCSGGLGPTADDITRECVAAAAGVEMEFHQDILDTIRGMFAQYNLTMTENNKRQAMVPVGAVVLDNPFGSAPGLMLECDRGIIFCMPGVPRELKPMLTNDIIPRLRERFDLKSIIHYRVVHLCGVGESQVDEVIKDLVNHSSNPTIGMLGTPAAVRVRIAAKASSIDEANGLIDPVEAQIRDYFPGLVMGTDEDTVEGAVDQLLCDRGWTLEIIETTSGGVIASKLAAIEAPSFQQGTVYPLHTLDLSDPEALSSGLAHQHQKTSSQTCVLAVVADPAKGTSIATFLHPDGEETWKLGYSRQSSVMQRRLSVLALEYLRRFLIR